MKRKKKPCRALKIIDATVEPEHPLVRAGRAVHEAAVGVAKAYNEVKSLIDKHRKGKRK